MRPTDIFSEIPAFIASLHRANQHPGGEMIGGKMGRSLRSASTFFSVLAFILLSPVLVFSANGPTVVVSVDASDAPRKILHAQLHIPAKPGTLTLYYPK